MITVAVTKHYLIFLLGVYSFSAVVRFVTFYIFTITYLPFKI